MIIMKSVIFCGAVLGCFVLKTTYAALGTEWTTPDIATITGSGTVTTAVPEDGSSFPTLAATGATTYAITSQTPAGVFAISAGGLLSLVGGQKLDYETNKYHVPVVTAGDGSTTGTANITININDVNDNPPAFPPAGYSNCVADATAAAMTVLTLTTTDADTGSTTKTANVISTMTITVGDTNTDFTVSKAGVLTTAKALNMSRKPGYALTVTAVDSDTSRKQTGSTTVFITVSDSCGGGGGCSNRSGTGILAASIGVTLLLGLVTSLV